MNKTKMLLGAATLALTLPAQAIAQRSSVITPPVAGVTAPSQYFPQEPGQDYFLANYTQYEAYLRKLATESNRMKLVEFGRTAEGRPMLMAIISSPENLAKLDHYKDIARRLAKADGLTDEQAHALAAEGKAVVWIDAGLHASETVPAQAQIHTIYRMLTGNDPETLRALDNCIILFAQDNPDGMELVANWYMRNPDPKKREMRSLPRLYQKYIGHDNNRDSFMAQQPETEAIDRAQFREWHPQVMYNQHQTGPAGMVVFVPPFRDPFNYHYDPLIMTELDEIGFAMHSRLISEGKGGSGARSAANYSTWHNGMVRSDAYFHNSIGILTEIIGGPTPETIPLVPETQLARNDEPLPKPPGEFHLRDALEYTWSMDRAVMDYSVRNRERLLYNIYRMGANGIARGRTDSWTITPAGLDELKEVAKTKPAPEPGPDDYFRVPRVDPKLYETVLRDPAKRDPRGYILTANQADMPTAIVFLNTLIKNGVDVMRATKAFTVNGKSYPAGSFVVRTDQAYRPHVLDMFEPQDHPHNVEYPGGPPIPPYDITGYNLTYQMGFQYDRILDAFNGPFEKLPDQLLTVPPGHVIGSGRAGWLIKHDTDNSFVLTNRLLKAGAQVQWLTGATTIGRDRLAPGAIWVPASPLAAGVIASGVTQLGVNAYAVGAKPRGATLPLKPVRIGVVGQYGGVIPEGWTKWILEQFEFPYTEVFPQELDAGNLNAKYDVLVFADGTVPGDGLAYRARKPFMPKPDDIPAEFRPWLGTITDAQTMPQLASFAQNGGTIIALGSAARLATALHAPLTPALTTTVNGKEAPLSTKDFFIPGAILQARVDPTQPLAYGMPEKTDVFFNQNQTFNLADGSGVKRIAWFDTATPLRSGWAWHAEKLNGTTAIADVDMGRGKLLVMGPEVTQRAQPYMTFKFLFNGLLYGPAASATR